MADELDKSQSTSQSDLDNIKALSALSADIPKLLSSAGSAISLLTNSTHVSKSLSGLPDIESESSGVDARKEAFLAHVRDYFSTLKGLEKALEKQTLALEDANIIPADREQQFTETGITNGGLGNLDVAWLNSRRRDVGLGKEQELRAEVDSWLKEAEEVKDEVMEDVNQ